MSRHGAGPEGWESGAVLSRRAALRLIPVAAACVAAAGCGYSLADRDSFLPDYIRTLGVPMFGNRTP